MPKTWVADDTGIFQAAKGIWVADAAGEFKKANAMWIAKDDGAFAAAGVGGPTIGSFTATPGAYPYTQITFIWSAANAVNYKIFQVGNPTAIWEGAPPSTQLGLQTFPSTAYQFFLRATDALGAYIDSDIVNITTTALPSPTGLHATGLVYNDFDLSWNPVTLASAYELQQTNGSGVYGPGASTGPIDFNPAASSTYYFRVRSYIGGSASGWSPTLTVTTPAVPGPAFGTYTVDATSAYTWQTGSGGLWRAQGDGLYHGDGADYGSARGKQTGCFFYGSGAFNHLAGGRVTKLEINLKREDDAGASAGQSCRWHLHTMGGKPSDTPLNNITNSADASTLARGEDKWIVLPTNWGQKLVDGEGNVKGIGWGNIADRYMHAAPIATRSANGRIRITIG